MTTNYTPKNLRMPKVDLKKKPTYELMSHIGKHAQQDISPHPFTKLKPPKKEKIEDIFIKSSINNSTKNSKAIGKKIKSEKNVNSKKKKSKKKNTTNKKKGKKKI